MKLDVLGIQAFVAIAEARNFGRAAEALHITQTALTRRLQTLEALLGVRLVERTTRTSTLSAIGEAFLPQARRLVGELAAALTEIRDHGKAGRGDVTIACVPTMGVRMLPAILRDHAASHPHNRVRVLDQAASTVVAAVLRREAEFGIGIAGVADDALESVPLLHDPFVLVCRRDHPWAPRRTLRWDRLGGHPLVYAGSDSGNRSVLDVALGGRGHDLTIAYEVQRSATALGIAAAGVAAAVVPELAVQPGADASLRTVALVDPVVTRPLALLTRKGAHLSPAAQALYDRVLAAARRARGAGRRSAQA